MTVRMDDLRALLAEAGVKPDLAGRLDPSAPLLRQGVDSIDFPSFCALLEERYGVTLNDEKALTLKTLDDFVRFLGER